MPKRIPVLMFVALLGALVQDSPSYGQSVERDNGNPTINGATVFAAWNSEAGKDIAKNFAEYPEFLPFLDGWDFRINLPHVRFQLAKPGKSSGPTMVGVVEDATPPDDANGTLRLYGHRNNSLWLFRVAADEGKGRVQFKVLPSRRELSSARTENVRSLVADWRSIAKPPGLSPRSDLSEGEAAEPDRDAITGPVGPGLGQAPSFRQEKVAAAVIGEGIGVATIYLVARAEDNSLHLTKRVVSSTDSVSWPQPWTPVGVSSLDRPALAAAVGGKLALTWRESGAVKARLFTPSSGTWGPIVTAASELAVGAPQLVSDGAALHLFFVSGTRTLQHAFALDGTLAFRDQVAVSADTVREDHFHAVAFNERLHVAFQGFTPTFAATPVRYTASTSPAGTRSLWSAPSDVGLSTDRAPQIGTVHDLLFVIGADASGRVKFSRKDPHQRGNDLTGGTADDRWLSAGAAVPQADVDLAELEALPFNGDIYLAASRTDGPGGTYLVNFSRAAVKHLITQRHGIKLLWGEPGGAAIQGVGGFAREGQIPQLGDFNGDRKEDVIRFTQQNETGVGPAPVYVALSDGGGVGDDQLWHRFFSLKGEIPLVGDFNGDKKSDIVTFTQKAQRNSTGRVTATAPVYVALSDGSKFNTSRIWNTFFSLKGEIPLVGDFNGDGKSDIITFTQKAQRDANGTVTATAPVYVALSNGTTFNTSRIWHTFFSLKGELPMVGDFNGDGKDDIATFVQQPHRDGSGTVIAQAPVWVALSDGTKFGQSRIWHNFFAPRGEVPVVADFNQDGKSDIATFLHDRPGTGDHARNVYVAFSLGDRFDRSITWHSDFAGKDQIPLVGHLSDKTLGDITGLDRDKDKFFPDLFAFRKDGAVHIATALRNTPVPSGAPWERYKWFTDKGVGVAWFPERVFQASKRCIGQPHSFALLGAAGSGGNTITNLSVRMGSRMQHAVEELGHSVFANCLRSNSDPFDLFESIYETSIANGGIDANNKPGCPTAFYDCRDPEHYFLGILNMYRADGDRFRNEINTSNGAVRSRLVTQYTWMKQKWFQGVEFKRGPLMNGGLTADGLQCLPGQCQSAGVPVAPPVVITEP